MAKSDDGDLILAQQHIRDARYSLERALERIRDNHSLPAYLVRYLVTRSQLSIVEALQSIDTLVPTPNGTVPPCGGDYASHDVALDAKPGDLAELLDCSEAVDREMSRGWEMRGAHASTDC